MEADTALWYRVEKEGFELVIVKLDQTDFTPALITVAGSKKKQVFNLSRINDYIPEFMRLADYIEKSEPSLLKGDIFVDRGLDRDKFSLLSIQNKILFVVGIAGIGKTAFVKHAVAEVLDKKAIEIKLTRGHSLERLTREILQKTHSSQPMDNVETRYLLTLSLEAIKSRAKRIFLFLNYAENALDTSNESLTFLHNFLSAFVEADIDTHVILATSRSPEIHPKIAKATAIYQLKGLETPYIQECLRLWTQDSPQSLHRVSGWVLRDVASLASGHPLAARLIAMELKGKGPAVLLTATEKKRVELKLGVFLLDSIDKDILSELHHLILQVLAVIREPMTLEDMLAIKEINKKYTIEELQQARSKLIDLLLIEQDYEMMSLNSFLMAYYQDQVDKIEKRQDQFAEDFGEYAYHKSITLKKTWDKIKYTGATDTELNKVSNDVFRYTVSADRLLRLSGKSNLISKLPIQIGGNVRDLVIHYYQHKRDYQKALRFAEEWLRDHPEDIEITLFQVRCYRNIEDQDGLHKAEEIIASLEKDSASTRLRQRLLRERALISEKFGDFERAEIFYRQGINLATINPYPENYIGLAHLLLRKIDRKVLSYFDEITNAVEAVRLLEIARDQSPVFDRFHLGTYIDALIQAGQGDIRPLA